MGLSCSKNENNSTNNDNSTGSDESVVNCTQPDNSSNSIECPLCYEITTDNVSICEELHTQICKNCAISYIKNKINSGYNGYCPTLSCPICQLEKKNRTMKYELVTKIIGKNFTDEYETFARSLAIIKCAGCHDQRTLLPRYDSDLSKLTHDYITDMKFYENGVITANQFYDCINLHHAKLKGYYDQNFLMLISKIQNPEKRISLVLKYFLSVGVIKTLCCSRLHCFKCKEQVSSSQHICISASNEDCLPCYSCNVTLTKADGCDSVTCVCGSEIKWSEALKKYKMSTKIESMFSDYKLKTQTHMSITDYYAMMLWNTKLSNEDIELLKLWIVPHDKQCDLCESMRKILISTNSIYFLHIFANKYVKSSKSSNMQMFLLCMSAKEKSIAYELIESYTLYAKMVNKYIGFKNDMMYLHLMMMDDSVNFTEIMLLFNDIPTLNNYNKYLKKQMFNIGIQYLYFNGSKCIANNMCETNLTQTGETEECDTYDNVTNMMFILNTNASFVLDIKLATHNNKQIVCKNNMLKFGNFNREFEVGDILQIYLNTTTNIFKLIVNDFVAIKKQLPKKYSKLTYRVSKPNVLIKLKRNAKIHTNFEQFRQFCMYSRLLKKITTGFKLNCDIVPKSNYSCSENELYEINKCICENFSMSYDMLKNFTFCDMCSFAESIYLNQSQLREKIKHENIIKFVELYSDETMYTALLINHGYIDVEQHVKNMAKLFIRENKDLATQFYIQDENNDDPIFDVKSSCKCIPRHLNGFSGSCKKS